MNEPVLIRELDKEKQVCPLCESRQIIRTGKRVSKHNIAQRYGCKICGTTFCESVHGYFKSKYPLYVKQFAIEMYLNGLALRKVKDKLQEDLGVEVSHVSIGNWLKQSGVDRRPKSSGDQLHRTNRDLIEIGVSTVIRFSSSIYPEKMIIIAESFTLDVLENREHAQLNPRTQI